MKIDKIKEKVLTAWKKQLAKYEAGPVVGEYYCTAGHCYVCSELEKIGGEGNACSYCPMSIELESECCDYKTFLLLIDQVRNCSEYSESKIIKITPELTAAMALRHRFYVEGFKILEPLPESRFESSEGFPELAALDKKLYEEFVK